MGNLNNKYKLSDLEKYLKLCKTNNYWQIIIKELLYKPIKEFYFI